VEYNLWLSIGFFLFFVFLSAFFSGSESAYFSLSPADVRKLREEMGKSGSARRVISLLAKPRRLLMSILVGNTLVNVAASTVAALFTRQVIPEHLLGNSGSILISIAVVTLVILIFSEVSPKVFAVKQAVPFALKVSWPLVQVVRLLIPLSFFFEKVSGGISSLLGLGHEAPFVNEEELKTLFEVGEEKGTLDQTEREMIHSIFEFRDTVVKEIMIPRMDMICLEKSTSLQDALKLIKEKGHSRIPVFDETVDNITGILFVKDLLPYMRGKRQVPSLEEMVRPAYFVPESKMIDELLKEFQKERIHMAIVVDEYGGTAGLITLEDVLEEIVGEIRDEHDKEKPLLQEVGKNTWVVDAKIDIEDFNEMLDLSIPTEEDYESLGGFIFSLMGRIPNEKEEVEYQNLQMIVEKVDGQRITRVRIRLKEE
jgi:gliding motility-associated protein GldE